MLSDKLRVAMLRRLLGVDLNDEPADNNYVLVLIGGIKCNDGERRKVLS